MAKRKGLITVITPDGHEYQATIHEKACACGPGLKVVPIHKELAFVRGFLPSVAMTMIRDRGWTARIDYDG